VRQYLGLGSVRGWVHVKCQPRAGLKVVLAVEVVEVPASPQQSVHAALAARANEEWWYRMSLN
jgi:hypothetical protein